MNLIKEGTRDVRLLRLINRYLKSGVMIGDDHKPTEEGTPQGGPLSPLLANLLLDRPDKALEDRGHRFARYADDCNIYVRSRRAGERVMAGVTKYLSLKLRLKVNEAKSAVARKQWGTNGYHELRRRGVSRDLAWNTAKSAHGPWRLSRSPALAFALPAKYFASLGLPNLYERN